MRRTLPPGFNPDAWRVRREFERIAAPLPDPPFKDAEKAEAAVARVVKALGVPDADPAALRLAESWAEIVGGGRGDKTFQTLVEGKVEGGELVMRVYNTDIDKLVAEHRFKPRAVSFMQDLRT